MEGDISSDEKCSHFTDVKTEVTSQRGNVSCPRSTSKEMMGLSLKPKAVQSQGLWVFPTSTPVSPRETHPQGKEDEEKAWGRDRGKAVGCPNVSQAQLRKISSLRA